MTILEQNSRVVGYDEIAEAFNLEESVVATMVMDAVVDIFVEGKRGTMDITSAATIYNIRHEDLVKSLVNLALDPGVMIKRNEIGLSQYSKGFLLSIYKKRFDNNEELFSLQWPTWIFKPQWRSGIGKQIQP